MQGGNELRWYVYSCAVVGLSVVRREPQEAILYHRAVLCPIIMSRAATLPMHSPPRNPATRPNAETRASLPADAHTLHLSSEEETLSEILRTAT